MAGIASFSMCTKNNLINLDKLKCLYIMYIVQLSEQLDLIVQLIQTDS